tara:strand:- start:32 stop:238 length:207 start_codon:yes stop_codon:yes gene_type:complete
MKEILLVWKYSLGSFSDSKTEKYDNWIALVRTVIFVSYMVTNSFIVAGVVRHWDSNRTVSVDTEYIKK